MNDENDYFEKLKFEHELLSRRVTWLLASQTILFAAYGVCGLADKHIENNKIIIEIIRVLVCCHLLLSLLELLRLFLQKH